MKENKSKSHMELFMEAYPAKDVATNPLIAASAMGYLKALRQFLPSDRGIDDAELALLKLMVRQMLGKDDDDE